MGGTFHGVFFFFFWGGGGVPMEAEVDLPVSSEK